MFRGRIRSVVRPAAAAVVLGAALGAGWPAAAAASGSPGTTTTTSSSTTTTAPSPVKASVKLYLPDVFWVQHGPVTVPKRVVHVVGIVGPYVPGQSVVVQALIGSRVFKTKRVALARTSGGRYGHFRVALASPGVGEVTVKVTHAASAQMLGWSSDRRFAALDEHVRPGSRGRLVELIQQRLAALHFYIPQTGVFDQGTGLALDAYHRLLRWGEGNESLDGRTISFLLDGYGTFKVRYPNHGEHAEGDLAEQVLALVNGSKVQELFPISSGKPSTPTILGDFHVYSRVPGYLPDGMYYSDFFIRGYAIHGYDPAPDYPASHGCMRLPIVDAITVYDWMRIGDWVDVYY